MYFHQCFLGICLQIFTYAFFINILQKQVRLRMRLLFQKVSHPIVIGPTIAKKTRKKVRMTARNKLPIISAKNEINHDRHLILAKSLKTYFFFFFRLPNNELISFLMSDSSFSCSGVFTKFLSLYFIRS